MEEKTFFSEKEMYCMAHDSKGHSTFVEAIPKHYRRKFAYDNMHLMTGMKFENGYPIMQAYTGKTDFELVPYTERKKQLGVGQALHFFLDDYRFRNAVWSTLERVTYGISKFEWVFTPDLSMWRNLATEIPNMNNVYRTRLIGAYWQSCGYNVIPTASWGGLDSFTYCFNGLPHDSVVAVSAMGAYKNRMQFDRWCYGLTRLEKDRHPRLILVYGDAVDISGLSTPVQFLPTFISKHFRHGK
jgi:hypothetical protein